jgi:hypothetical protein
VCMGWYLEDTATTRAITCLCVQLAGVHTHGLNTLCTIAAARGRHTWYMNSLLHCLATSEGGRTYLTGILTQLQGTA